MGLDKCLQKYAILKKSDTDHPFPKDHAQPGKLLETFKTASAVPKIRRAGSEILPLKTQTLCGQPVLHVKHKQPVQSVHLRGGQRPEGCRFDFEDLRIRKEMMGRADESSQTDTKASNRDLILDFV